MVSASWCRPSAPIGLAAFEQCRRRPDDRDQRRPEVVADRGQQRAAQALGLGEDPALLDVGRQLRPLDGDRHLIDQRVEQAAAFRIQLLVRSRKRRRAQPADSGRS